VVTRAPARLTDPREVAYMVAAMSPIEAQVRQEILEIDSVPEKLRRLVDVLQRELAVRERSVKISSQTQERLTKAQREHYLREQLRSIQQELGEEGSGAPDELRKKIEEANLPEEAAKPSASSGVSRHPGGVPRRHLPPRVDVRRCPNTLSRGDRVATRRVPPDHYDIDVKDRILEARR
jgi:ATP-dependent Lon protease